MSKKALLAELDSHFLPEPEEMERIYTLLEIEAERHDLASLKEEAVWLAVRFHTLGMNYGIRKERHCRRIPKKQRKAVKRNGN